MPAWSMNATGGLTHFIDGDAVERVAGAVRELAARPAARGAERLEGRADSRPATGSCSGASAPATQRGQPSDSTSARGRPNGKSKAASHGPGERSRASERGEVGMGDDRVERDRRRIAARIEPNATVIGFLRDGALVRVDAGEFASPISRARARRHRRRCTPRRRQADDRVAFAEQAAAESARANSIEGTSRAERARLIRREPPSRRARARSRAVRALATTSAAHATACGSIRRKPRRSRSHAGGQQDGTRRRCRRSRRGSAGAAAPPTA